MSDGLTKVLVVRAFGCSQRRQMPSALQCIFTLSREHVRYVLRQQQYLKENPLIQEMRCVIGRDELLVQDVDEMPEDRQMQEYVEILDMSAVSETTPDLLDEIGGRIVLRIQAVDIFWECWDVNDYEDDLLWATAEVTTDDLEQYLKAQTPLISTTVAFRVTGVYKWIPLSDDTWCFVIFDEEDIAYLRNPEREGQRTVANVCMMPASRLPNPEETATLTTAWAVPWPWTPACIVLPERPIWTTQPTDWLPTPDSTLKLEMTVFDGNIVWIWTSTDPATWVASTDVPVEAVLQEVARKCAENR